MKCNYQESFRQDLAKILGRYNDISPKLGNKLGQAIALEIQNVCEELHRIKDKTDFIEEIKEKFKYSIRRPKIYSDKGYINCEELLFEYKFNTLGFFVVFGFCFPFMFTTENQKLELSSFTPRATEKFTDRECIEFFFVVANAEGSLEFS